MPITETRLSELNNIAAGTPNGCTFDLDIVEAHALLGELTAWRRKYPTVSTASAVETQLRQERVKLQDENLTLQTENERYGERIGQLEELVLKIERDWFARAAEIESQAGKLSDRITTLNNEIVALESTAHGVAAFNGRLAERIGAIETHFEGYYGFHSGVVEPAEVPFPTGAATAVDEVLAAVPAVEEQDDGPPPRRGDRVRLEGAFSAHLATPIESGWYDVVGRDRSNFQIKGNRSGWVPYVRDSHPGLKEVRRGAAQLD